MCSKRRRNTQTKWESIASKYEGRNNELEEKECELQERLDLLEKTTPRVVLYNMWKLMQNEPTPSFRESRSRSRDLSRSPKEAGDSRGRSRSPLQSKQKSPTTSDSKIMLQQYVRSLEEDKGQLTKQKHCMEQMIKLLEMQLQEKSNQTTTTNNNIEEDDSISIGSAEFDLIKSVQELKERGNEMSKRIEVLEKRETAYLETLKQADEICAEMEIEYKQHCFKAEQNEAEMRDRLQRLKKREEFEKRCSFGDTIHKKCLKQDHPRYWSMFDPICSMLNRWH